MEEINDFFDITKGIKREILSPGYVNAKTVVKPNTNRFVQRVFIGKDYGDKYRMAEMEELKKIDFDSIPSKLPIRSHHQSTVDDVDSEIGDDNRIEGDVVDDVYSRYDFNRKLPDLSICEIKEEILRTIEKNPVVVIEGATGCGKTTQVPQFILDDGYEQRKHVNIVVTQPRRIAAISIAHRVAKERDLPKLPHLIGYQIGLNVNTHDDTRITFCTTGVLLEKLVTCKTLSNYTHVVLEEVHERSQDMDFLFIVIKQLRRTAPHVKIILMSATIEAKEFAEYFSFYRSGAKGTLLTPAPIIKVEKKSNFKIREFYLDDLVRLNVNMNIPSNPTIEEDMYMTAVKLIFYANCIDAADQLEPQRKPSFLIFLPGIYEIALMNKYIEDSVQAVMHDDNIVVVLHSMITHDEQVRALRAPTPGKRMIILATNIAESSITVPDVKYVIDFCLTKTNVTDTTTNFTSLQLEWCSRSNCRQRAGRTGRTIDGRVYRLVTRNFYENQMEESSLPEMCRCPLENVVLKAKQLNMGPPTKIISLAMDRPTMYNIQNTILLLKESGALLRTVDGHYSDEDGDMTFIGHVMTALPVNILVAKLVVLGHVFSVLSECIIIAAGLTTKSIFVQGIKNPVTYYSKKLVWSDGSGSDLFAILKAYKAYFDRVNTHGNAKKWAERYYLNEKSLNEMTHLIAEMTMRLERLGIKERMGVNRAKWSAAEKSIILKVVIAGAFYPYYFVRSCNEMGDREIFRTINGRNPCNTVFFTGFEEKYIRPLYVQSIKKLLKPCTNSDNIQVTFDEGNEKVFVSFKQTKASIEANVHPDLDFTEMGPGQVCLEVYKAMKLKMSSKPLEIRVMYPDDAQKYVENLKVGSLVKGKWEINKKVIKNIEMVCLPRKHIKNVTGKITHYETIFNRFWLRSIDEDRLFNEIQSELNSFNQEIEEFSDYGDVSVGKVVAASYNGRYYRAKILLAVRGTSNVFYTVQFMDIGLEGDVGFSQLRRLRGRSAKFIDIPPRVFECRLACLQPSELHSARYGWESTMLQFKKLTFDCSVCAEIYSVENGIASVFIYVANRTVQDILIDDGFARTADENFMSKVDHDLRVRAQTRNDFDKELHSIEEEMRKMMPFEETCDIPEPDISKRHKYITLKGPKSPLQSTIYSCLDQAKSQSKKVGIEPHSVNSVLLEGNPQDSFEKYIVAVNVTENQNKTELTARETTIMPNIPGFGPFLALIFSPYCEFFRDKCKSRFVAILCGLGEHPINKTPIYSEHDVHLNLDTEIDVPDIENINTIRFLMDNLLQMSPDQKQTKATEYEQNQLANQIKNAIIKLLEKNRPLTGISYDYDIGWSKYPPRDLIKARDVFATSAIFPFHNILNLAAADSPERLEQLNRLIENNKELHRISKYEVSLIRPVKCQLCCLDLESASELKVHLYSRLHTEREKKISLEF